MNQDVVSLSIRAIFLTPRPHTALTIAADRLGISLSDLKKEIAEGRL